MAYNELIKNFNRIREYMRDFYLYGFKSRDVVASCSQSGLQLFTSLRLPVQFTTGRCPISTPSVSSFILPLQGIIKKYPSP